MRAAKAGETNLELGFPANVTHVITPSSPLYNLSLLEMDTRMMEILVFVDGIDAMTSKNMSARHAYNTNEVHINEQFLPLHLEMRGRSLGLDFSGFDATALASTELLAEHNADPGMAERPLPEIQSHMWHLRHMTFKRLTDRAEPGQAQAQAPGPNPTVAGLSAGGAGLPVSSGPASAGGFGSAIPRAHVGPLSASASSSGGGGAGIVGGHHIGLSVSSNPFAAPGAAAAAAELPPAAAASGGGGASWMGFGMTLQPQHPPPPSGPMPLSAFLAASGSGLESFADMPSHAQPAGYATTAHHVTHRTWAGSAAGAAAPPSGAATGAAAPLVGAGLGAGAGQGVEMLPTSSAAVEPRGVNGMGSR
ncbi:hypothetical protein HYH03_008980 [Edaphochlamys debaryana]|uniref:Inward rectifier potassium channel C-terminal domain-containing protein n=1 Tax=Edaphochlamys debaryana TaxID=47281 RepID=A0A836BYB7_9CHLO|nr:hypothetical protein HYH03_008980 [Edaphochlamys debaryana]|eukprot:KAG2492822.1 hypothetical protein HYH03_008980 [Edaphochlamys debaryana]